MIFSNFLEFSKLFEDFVCIFLFTEFLENILKNPQFC